MPRLLAALPLTALLAAGPAQAFDAGTRLSIGLDPGLASSPAARLKPDGGLRLNLGVLGPLAGGPAVEPVPEGFHLIPGGHGRKALGGYLEAELLAGLRVTGLVARAADGGRAEISGSYSFGDNRLVMTLGGEWSETTAFADGAYQDSVDLSVSLQHDITPGLYVAGTAAASATPEAQSDRNVLFGASVGLRF